MMIDLLILETIFHWRQICLNYREVPPESFAFSCMRRADDDAARRITSPGPHHKNKKINLGFIRALLGLAASRAAVRHHKTRIRL
jgi:hypothetical protein